jgi:hypothetical protein
MPFKMRKPNLGGQLKTSFNMGIPRAGGQKPGRVGEVATNNKIFSLNSGGRAPKSAGPKRGRRMY